MFPHALVSGSQVKWIADVYEAPKEAGELDGLLEVVRAIVESGEPTKH